MATLKTKKLQRKVKTDKEYLEYANKYKAQPSSDNQPMTRYHWERSGRNVAYGATGGTTELARLRHKERKSVGMND